MSFINDSQSGMGMFWYTAEICFFFYLLLQFLLQQELYLIMILSSVLLGVACPVLLSASK